MTKNYIGVLDSGVGGLSVLSQLKKIMPHNNFIFFGDTKNVPYGTKSPKEIFQFTKKILDFFVEKDVKNVVFACNTTSAVAYEDLKNEFKNKLKIYPLIQSVAPYCIQNLKNDKIAILATRATVNSKKYDEEIKKYNPDIEIIDIDCTGFVEIVEKRLYEDKSSIDLIKSKLDIVKDFKAKRAVLGCTHYPYLVDIFKKILDIEYFNPAICLSEIVKNDLYEQKGEGEIEFFASKNPQEFIKSAKLFFNIEKCQLFKS